MTTTTYTPPMTPTSPTVRGDATLLAANERGGWHGYEAHWMLPAAGVVLDGLLAGVLDISGRKILFVDRRRVVPGPYAQSPLTEPLARLARRLPAVAPEAPYEWVRHTATFAPELVLDELAARGAGRRFDGRWNPFGRTPGLVDRDPVQYAAALDRVEAACTGRADATQQGLTTALLLQLVEALHKVVPKSKSRAVLRHLRAAQRDLPLAAQAMLETLQEQKAREDMVQH